MAHSGAVYNSDFLINFSKVLRIMNIAKVDRHKSIVKHVEWLPIMLEPKRQVSHYIAGLNFALSPCVIKYS